MENIFIKIIADYLVIVVVILATYALIRYIPNKNKFKAYSRILIAGLTAYLLAKLVASVYQPSDSRPYELLGVDPGASYLDNPGFPSDHMLFVSALVLAVWFETRKKTLTIVLVSMAALVGLGRILALVHAPIDVLFGAIIAMVGALWYTNNPKTRSVSLSGGQKRKVRDGKSSS